MVVLHKIQNGLVSVYQYTDAKFFDTDDENPRPPLFYFSNLVTINRRYCNFFFFIFFNSKKKKKSDSIYFLIKILSFMNLIAPISHSAYNKLISMKSNKNVDIV